MKVFRLGVMLLASLLLLVVVTGTGFAGEEEEFPQDRPIRLINPYDPGGGVDIAARILSATAPEFIDQSVTVTSMSGAGGQEAMNYVLDNPTGYNLLVTDFVLINQALTEDVRYELDEWVPIVELAEMVPVFFVRQDSPIETMDDFVEMAEADPESITIAHGRHLAPPHLPLILLEEETGIRNTHVPTTGGAEARAFVEGGEVDMGVSLTTSIADMVEAGTYRAIGVTSSERDGFLPDVPTLQEQGYDVTMTIWFTVFAHENTPEEDRRMLEEAFLAALESDSAQEMASRADVDLTLRGMDEAGEIYRNDIENLRVILEAAGEI